MRKLCRVLFSRYFVSAVMILAELAGLLFLFLYASRYSAVFYVLSLIINVAVIFSLINKEANPEYKVSWLAVLIFIPVFGSLLYLMFYSRRITKREAEFSESILGEFDRFEGVEEEDKTFSMLKSEDALASGKALAILNDDRISKIYRETESEYFAFGEDMYRSMLEDLRNAEKYIFLEYFIIEEGEMWSGILEILKEKVAAGLDVRVLYDDIGSMKTLPARYDKRLSFLGIKSRRFSPVNPSISTAHNNRDHRKLCIIDGACAYTGGINIADEYINKTVRFGHWKDGGVRIFGSAVEGMLKQFLGMWDASVGGFSDYQGLLSSVKPCKGDGGYYIPFGSGPAPIYTRPVGKNAFLNIINQASEYVYITTPYLIVDYDLTEAMRNAALRGIDVKIITPAVADKKTVKVMTKSSYAYLMEAGVKIYEYTEGFIHAKTVLSDDLYAIIGTINFDYRSLAHHYENAVWMYKTKTVFCAKADFEETLSLSEKQNESDARLTLKERIIKRGVRIFAPLL